MNPATYYRFTLQLNSERDKELIAWLEAQPNKTDCIRRALRKLMEEERRQNIGERRQDVGS